MQSERENILPENKNGAVSSIDFDIAGNSIRAYYDANGRLVFVLDSTLNAQKPNVLLVINPVADRKWDDILVNDYGVDLERVRPKKNNKYQKLDIEYSGLDQYEGLIRVFRDGGDVTAALRALDDFRNQSVRRAASERLAAAMDVVEKAQETIEKTTETIADIKSRQKELRVTLGRHRREVGKKPTKQSAAKILRTEAQIDVLDEKMRRARRRLANAQRRLETAEEDAAAARLILNMDPAPTDGGNNTEDRIPVMPALVGIPVFKDLEPVSETEEIIIDEPKAEEMAEDEVKPLFDKDPEILDEEIAFKPIDFDMPSVTPAPSAVTTSGRDDVVPYADKAPAPLSFTPPVADVAARESQDGYAVNNGQESMRAPVLDAMTPIEIPQSADVVVEEFVPTPVVESVPPVAPSRPVSPSVMAAQDVRPAAPMPDIAPAPVGSDVRPVSPITNSGVPVTPVGGAGGRKTSLVYYIMLIALIVLSVFTLWIYQKSASENVPDLVAAPHADNASGGQNDGPFIDGAAVVETAEPVEIAPEPVVEEPVLEPAPVEEVVIAPEPEPVIEEPVEVIEDVAVAPEPVMVTEPEPVPDPESPFLTAPVPEPVAEEVVQPAPAPEPVVNKPAYNVSQQENMFIAGDNYETDDTYYEDESQYVDDGAVYQDTVSGGGYPIDGGREYYYEDVATDDAMYPQY